VIVLLLGEEKAPTPRSVTGPAYAPGVSLTSQLRTKGSVLWTFMEEWFPNTAATARMDPGPMLVCPTDRAGYPWAVVGTALDYRIRFFYGPPIIEQLVAHRGAKRLMEVWGREGDMPTTFGPLTRALQSEIPRRADHWKAKSAKNEKRLARLCFVLALYEDCGRSEPQSEWPIVQLGPRAKLSDLEALCPAQVVDDLVALAAVFRDRAGLVFREQPVVLNPAFIGAIGIGGADADLILGQTLIDIKATIKGKPDRTALWQLIGYALCDDIDEYRLKQVGFYFARFGRTVCWELPALLDALAGRSIDLADVRQAFRELPASDEDGMAVITRPKRLSPFGVVHTANFYPTRSGRGAWHLPFAEVPGLTPPRGTDRATAPACKSRAVLDPAGKVIRPLQGQRFSLADQRLCRTCLLMTGLSFDKGHGGAPYTVPRGDEDRVLDEVFPGDLRDR
jgi:hypothetical protein